MESVSGNPEIKFSFRVPQYTSLEVLVNGKKVVSGDKGIIAFKKKVEAGDVIELLFDMPLTTVVNPDKSISFRKGTLLLRRNFAQSAIRAAKSRFVTTNTRRFRSGAPCPNFNIKNI